MNSTEETRARLLLRRLAAALSVLALSAFASTAEEGAGPIVARSAVGAPAMSAARIMGGQEGGSLPLSVAALSEPLVSGEILVSILLHVDGPALLAGVAERPRLPVGIFAYAVAPGGKIAAALSEVVQIDLAERRGCLERGGLRFLGAVELEPGRYSLRVFVRGAAAADSALRIVELDLPAAGEKRQTLLPPMFGSRGAGCVALQQAIAEGGVGGSRIDADDPPDARPSLVVGTPIEFVLLVDLAGEAPLALELFDASQRLAATLPVVVLERGAAGDAGLERLLASVDPGDLEPGSYRLRARADTAAAGPVWSSWLDVEVVAPELPETMPIARTVAHGKRETAAAAAAASRDYRAALGMLARGDWPAAQAALVGLELGAGGDEITQALAQIAAAEDAVMERIAASQATALIPVYVLHRNLHNRYRVEGQFLFARHARGRAERAIDLFQKSTAWLESRGTVADLLANLAGELQRVGLLQLSRPLFERALQGMPQHPAALLGLAAQLEKDAAYAEAAQLLEQLLATQPDNAQAALRLAVNLRRLERRREAVRLLEPLASGGAPPWVHSLACQELAGLRLRQDPAAAETVLRQCLERSPQDEKLLLQLAFVVNSEGRPREARQLLEQQGFGAISGPGASPRYRYSLWPVEALAATRDRVRAGALAGLPALASSLAAEGGSGS